MSTHKPSLSEKICGEYLPFVIWSFGAVVINWMLFGDHVKNMI